MSDLSSTNGNVVGVEVTTSVLRAVCLDRDGVVTASRTTALIRGDDVLPQIVAFIKSLPAEFGPFHQVGVTFPGLIRRDSRTVAYSTAFPEHHDVDLLGEISSATGLEVVIENDANSAAYAEFMLGAGRGNKNLFYVMLGSGVGGAFIFEGRIWHGALGFAGEFGYLAIDEDGTRLEEVASATNIVRRTRQRFHQDSTSSLGKLPESEITVADVVRAARDGDDFAHLMLERTGKYVGTAIAGVINLLNVEKVVVGGEVMYGEHTVLDGIIRKAEELSFKPSFAGTKIVAGELRENAPAIGVALLAARR